MPNVWPPGLPNIQGADVRENTQETILRTQMDAGPDKVRRLFTAASRFYKFTVEFTTTEKAAFDVFWDDTLGGGIEEFEWEDPITDETVEFRFASTSKPSFALAIRSTNPNNRVWVAELELERLP